MSDRPVATTIEALGVYLWHMSETQDALRDQVAAIAKAQEAMATHNDIRRIEERLADLATKAEVEDKIKAVREQLTAASPAKRMDAIAKFFAQIAVISAGICAVLGVLYGAVHVYDDIRDARAARSAKP